MSGQRKQPPGKKPQGKEPWPWQKSKPATRGAATATKGGKGGKRPAGGKPRRGPVRRWVQRILIAGLIGFALLVVAFWVAYANTDIPDPNAEYQTETTYVYYDDGKTVLGKFALQDRDSIELSEMGQYTADSVIAAEDRTFYSNSGIDPKGILRAAFSNAQGNAVQGASTITQQYVKVLYLTQERSYKRKIKEAFVALKLRDEKDEVLQGYLNTIYFGRGAYGIEAAAKAYFGIPASQLNLKQSAALSAVINSPNNYDPAKGDAAKAALFSRYLYVLDSLSDMDKITSEELVKASKKLPKFPRIQSTNGAVGQSGYILDMVRNELRALDFSDQEIDGGGLRITTSINKAVMDAAEQAVLEQRPPDLPELHIAVASVDPKTGGLRGLYAGAPYERTNGGTNWANTGQAPGSTFKAFALAAGLADGYGLKSTFDGRSPITIGGTDFSNQGDGAGRSYGSRISLLDATENSVNTAYVDLTDAMDDGPQKVYDMAREMGIPRLTNGRRNGLEPNAGIALGSADITPIDMANGYATIAAQGLAKKWFVVDNVKNNGGNELYQHKVRTKRVLEEDVASDVSFALENVIISGTGRNADLDRPAAGKTGTATDDDGNVRSSWFVGYTPQLATAVMYVRGDGNDSLQDYMPTFFGGEYPARTWAATMSRALEGQPIEEFPEPALKAPTQTNNAPLPTFKPKPPPPPKPTKKPDKKPSKEPDPIPDPQPPLQTEIPNPTQPVEPPPTFPTDFPNPCDPFPACIPSEPAPPNGRAF